MASLDKKIEAYMGRSVDFTTEVTLQNDIKVHILLNGI